VAIANMSRLDRVEDWVEQGELSHYDAGELARLCSVSYSQLRRYFAAQFGKAPQAWLTEMRLWQVPNLVCSTCLSVKDIARELHFADESHLCHQFKNHFGCKPSEFKVRYCQPQEGGFKSLTEFGRSVVQRGLSKAPPSEIQKGYLSERWNISSLPIGKTSPT
jgi:AraC-like DNA-binding protein